MNLNLSQIKAITTGVVRVEQSENEIHFYRFTKEQEELYKNRRDDFYLKTFATSGIRMCFRTNSQTLRLVAEISAGSSRRYFAFDLFVNGKKIGALDNFSEVELPRDYTGVTLPMGEFSKEFCLGTGEKDVCVYFPWSVKAVLKEISIDDDSFVAPIRPSKKMLCFGDSITQGYDALHPSSKYISQLADMLDAQEYNKAIGGEIFFPALAAAKEAFEPDYITVAYGTNDWNRCTKEAFISNCREFLANLKNNYPAAKIFVITPIWRKDMDQIRPFGDFKSVGEIIQDQAAAFDNVFVVEGFGFVPKDERLYADLRLHPNDKGYEYYFANLWKQITQMLES